MLNKQKLAQMLILSVALSQAAGASGTAYAAGWIKSANPPAQAGISSGWWYALNDDGSAWYAPDDAHDVLWQWIDGNKDGTAECYAFSKAGWMYADTATPDGYTVNADGAWTVDGNVQTKQVYVSYGTSGVAGTGSGSSGGGGGSGSSGGNGTHNAGSGNTGDTGKDPDDGTDQPEETIYPYIVRLTDEDSGDVLKEINGKGQPGEDISFGFDVPEYELIPGQALSAPLQSEGEIFVVRYQKLGGKATDSNAKKQVYAYTISYMDIDTKAVLMAETGKAEKGSTVGIEHPDIDGYEICPDQKDSFKLSTDKTDLKIYYRAVATATPSVAKKVDWTVHFVEQDDHAKKLWASQSGQIADGGTLTINFPETIYGDDGTVWESVETPPVERQIFGTGRHIEYIEFINSGELPDGADPDQAAKELLNSYLETAKGYEAEITGEETDKIPDSRFYIENQTANDYRVRSIAMQVSDTQEHTFYVIGENFVPNGKTIAEWFGDEAEYSNLLEEVIRIGSDTYYVARMGIQRSFSPKAGQHDWRIVSENPATCLGKGRTTYVDGLTGEEQEVLTAPLGHIDEDGDSICDRCHTRAFPQEIGSQINASLKGAALTFTCIDDDYEGGMLYLADQAVPVSMFGGYGDAVYGNSNPYKYFRDGFQNGFSIKNGMIGVQIPGTDGTSYGFSLSKYDYEQYKDRISGGGFLLRDSTGGKVAGVGTDGAYTEELPEETQLGIRTAIVLEKPDAGMADRIHWNIGDVQAREIDGKTYMFRCIDQNYSDAGGNHRQAALFLMDSIIPANYGSDYKVKVQADGSHKYVFTPGPIVNFGDGNDYKYSKIRKWIGQARDSLFNTEPIRIGVDYAFMGSTPEKEYSAFDSNSLKPYYIGNQQMLEYMFILSVDEAARYKEYLWKFDGASEENPDTQYGAFSKGYWLRSPMGNPDNYDETGYAYVVDTVNGNIHPAAVKPDGTTGNDELDKTSVYGIRPVFTMPQD